MKVAVADLPDLSPGDSQQTSADSTVRVLFLSRFCPDFCLSDRILSEIKKNAIRCLSVCLSSQGRDRAVRIFGVLVRRRLLEVLTD